MADVGIRISAEDATKSAFDGVNRSLRGLEGSTVSVKSALDSMGSSAMLAMSPVALIGSALAALFSAASIKGAVDLADNFSKLSQKSGVAVESLRELNYAASLSDVSTEALGNGLRKLSQNMALAASGSVDQAAAFSAIGVNVKNMDGSLKGADQTLTEVAGKFANFKDGPEKAALAIELFGRQGAELIPLLNAGTSGLSEMSKEANALGVVFSGDLAKQAEAFNDNLTRIGTAAEGAKLALAKELVPTLNALAEAFLKAQEGSSSFAQAVGVGVRTVIEAATILYSDVEFVLKSLGLTFGAIAAQIAALGRLDIRGFSAINDAVKDDIARARKELDKFQYDLLTTGILTSKAGAGRGTAPDPRSLGDPSTTAPIIPATAATIAAAAAAKKAIADQNRELAEQGKLLAELSGLSGSFAADWDRLSAVYKSGKLSLEGLTKAQSDLLGKQPAIKAARDSEAKAYEDEQKAREAYSKTVADDLGRMADSNESLQGQIDRMGLSKRAVAELDAAHIELQATKLDGLAIDRLVQYQDNINFELLKFQAEEKRKQAALIRSGATKEAGVEAAKATAEEWKKASDQINQSLTDALFRAFESGKGFFDTLWSGIKNLFKTTVLKLAIQGVVGGVTGLGMSAANAAMGGSGAGYLSMASNASSLYSAGSTFTVGSQVLGGTMGVANGLGTIAANATGTGISGLLATNGAYGTAAAGSGSAIAGGATAALAAIPVWGWVALAAIAVAGMFGGRGKKEVTGGGIEGNFGNAGFAGNTFSTWKQDGGWFRSDRTGKETGALDSATSKQFSDSYKAVQSAASGAALALGLSADSITNYSERISLQLTGDAAANEKAITAMFSRLGDNLASAAAPGIAQLAKEGETAGGTLSRLAASLTTANAWLDRFGANMLQVSLSGGDAASKLADLFGGLENLNTASSAFYATYFSDAERAAQSTEDMGKALGALGLALPDSKEAFRTLALSMDQTTDAGRKAYATLLLIAPEFAATSDALATMAAEATAAIESLFARLSDGIKSAIDSIAGERGAVAAAVLQINNPGVMSRDAILRGINGTALATPGNAGLSAAQTALGQADAAVAAQAAAVAYAKTQTPSRAALDAAGGTLGAAQNATRAAQAQVDFRRDTEGGKFAWWVDQALAGNSPGFRGGDMRWGENQAVAEAKALLAARQAEQSPQAAYDAQLSSYGGAQAANAVQVAAAQAQLTAATAAQANAVTAAKTAQLAYIASLQDFAIDASKAVSKLGTLREETLKYYDAQKQLADLMTSSAGNLRGAVSAARTGQLDPAQSLAQQQGGFASAYSMAMATTGAAQAGYADKLTAALPGLSTALMDTASTREDWARATGTLFAQSEAIAQQLEANAPQDYAADSLAMLGQIDAALLVLDASSKSAEKIIADAVTAGSENTANGLRAVIAALTGSPIPAFALGGSFGGGLRIVGENGPELEATGPSRIFSASQTRSMLGGSGSDEMVQELRALRQEVAGLRAEAQATAGHTSKTARLLDRAMPDGDALATRAAV